MTRINIGLELFARQVRAKAAMLSSDRQRRVINVYVEHGIAETAGEIDWLMKNDER